jgi:hypothetical protein
VLIKPLILVDGIKTLLRRDVAQAIARRYHTDSYVGDAKTDVQTYQKWMDVADMSGVVIESSWQTSRVASVLGVHTTLSSDQRGILSIRARQRSAITVHVTSYVETLILGAANEKADSKLSMKELDLLFKAYREWELPEFHVAPVVTVNPYADDLIDSFFPKLDAQFDELGIDYVKMRRLR